MPIGFTLPFLKSTGSLGYLEFTSDEMSAVRSNLKSLLLTNWGERVMHYNFGCNLIEFLFEQPSNSTKSRIADRITSQVSKWIPYVNIQELNILYNSDDGSVPDQAIAIRIKFNLSYKPDLSSVLEVTFTP